MKNDSFTTHLQLVNEVQNAISYINKIPTCDSCGKQYGLVIKIKSVGAYCFPCFRSALDKVFKESPDLDYVLIRGIKHRI